MLAALEEREIDTEDLICINEYWINAFAGMQELVGLILEADFTDGALEIASNVLLVSKAIKRKEEAERNGNGDRR